MDVPTDPGERKAALAPHKFMARMGVKAYDKTLQFAGTSALDDEEKDAGTEAGAAILYAYQANASPWFALGMFFLGTGLSRLPEFLEVQEKKRKAADDKRRGVIPIPVNGAEREVKGTANIVSVNPAS